jgi:hypothetical protein
MHKNMKTLYESILADMKDTLDKGDSFVENIENEFEVIKSIKNLACWQKTRIAGGNCTIYEYKWDCTNTMKSLGNEKRNQIELSLQYITKKSVLGEPGWIITILLKPNPPVSLKDGFAQQILYKEFKLTDFKTTNKLINEYLLKEIFADYKTFSKFFNDNKLD